MTGISSVLEDSYQMYPSVEVDIVAVNAAEADEIKSAGVDAYFSPDNPLRSRLDPFTIFFSGEHTEPVVLPYDGPPWFVWRGKKPETLAVIASLPDDPDASPSDPDPRMLFVPLKKHWFIKKWYFEVEPQSVVQIYKKPVDPRLVTPDSPDTDTPTSSQSTIVRDSARTQADRAAAQAERKRERAEAKAERDAAKAEAKARKAQEKADAARAKADAAKVKADAIGK
jgi:hypothetical protein